MRQSEATPDGIEPVFSRSVRATKLVAHPGTNAPEESCRNSHEDTLGMRSSLRFQWVFMTVGRDAT